MTKTELITKYMAWMDLYYEGDELNFLQNHLNKKGERCIESYIPLLDKTIKGTSNRVDKAFDLFFETFSIEVDEYMKDKPEIKDAVEKQMKRIDEEHKKETEERKRMRSHFDESQKIRFDIMADRFNKDLDESMDMINNTVRDVAMVLDEEEYRLYIKVLSRDYFPEDESNDSISMKMQTMCREELRGSELILLFVRCRVFDNFVIVLGMTERL